MPSKKSRPAPTPELLELIATRFRVLAEPARLRILHSLEGGELSVTELVERTGLSQGNLSKHLQQLHQSGFVARRRDGLFAYYGLADDRVFDLCDMMCGRMEEMIGEARRVLAAR